MYNLQGKKGLITGVANDKSIAYAVAKAVREMGAEIALTYQNDKTAKYTQPTLFLLVPGQKPEVHYAWPLAGVKGCPVADIERAARSLTTLGWGIDMAFADARLAAEAELQTLKGVRWYPKDRDYPFKDTLRVPTYDDTLGECTLCDLRHCHSTMMNRIEHGKLLKTVDKPKVFDRVLYTSVERPAPRPHAVFRFLDSDDRPTRYPHAQLVHVAGMVRHLAIQRMLQNPPPWHRSDAEAWVNAFVRGKADDHAEPLARISYVPLPSIGHAHSDAMIRNVMLVAPLGAERDLEYVASRLDGQMLQPEPDSRCAWEHQCNAPHPAEIRLERFNPPRGKFIDARYLASSTVWHTVTPVILDGHNDKKDAKTIRLIQLALQRAGIETPCDFTWQAIPFFKNCLTAHKYDRDRRFIGYHRPQHLKDRTALHVKLAFHDGSSYKRPVKVPGPITLGAGRHCGLGLFANAD